MTSLSHQFRQKPASTAAEQEENLINLDEDSPLPRSPALQRATNIEVPARSAPPRQKGPVPCYSTNAENPATPSATTPAPAPKPNPINVAQPSYRTEAEKARLQKSRDEHARFFAAQEEQARLYGYVQHNPRHGPPQAVNPSTFSTVSLIPGTPNDGPPSHLLLAKLTPSFYSNQPRRRLLAFLKNGSNKLERKLPPSSKPVSTPRNGRKKPTSHVQRERALNKRES